MQFLTGWISNIILLILLATILELLLPNSSLQRYVKMVVGLLLLVIILNPLFSLFSKDVNSWVDSLGIVSQFEDENLQISVESKKKEIQQAQLAYISEQVAVQLKRQVEEEMITKFDSEVVNVNVTLTNFLEEKDYLDSISAVTVKLQTITEVNEVDQKVKPVAIVSIDTKSEAKFVTEEAPNKQQILSYLASQWQIPVEIIDVVMEGGGQTQ